MIFDSVHSDFTHLRATVKKSSGIRIWESFENQFLVSNKYDDFKWTGCTYVQVYIYIYSYMYMYVYLEF